MNSDPASLDNLRDLAQLPPVSWWPLAVGWWVVLGIGLVIAAAIAWCRWRRWRDNAYRRAALKELESAASVATIAAIIKRTALAAYPRTDVAALSGSAWCRWLGETGFQPVPPSVAESLQEGVFAPQSPAHVDELTAFAADWIRQHRPQPPDAQEGGRLPEGPPC